MSRSRDDFPVGSLYPEVGSSYDSRYAYSFTDGNNSTSSRSSRRNNSPNRRRHRSSSRGSSYHGDYPRSRDHRHRDRDERSVRDSRRRHSSTYDDRRGRGRDYVDRKNARSSSSGNNRTIKQRTKPIWEKFIPPDYRPSKADPEAREHRLSKERECEGFNWTPVGVLALIGATALFSVEKSLVRRRPKEYIQR